MKNGKNWKKIHSARALDGVYYYIKFLRIITNMNSYAVHNDLLHIVLHGFLHRSTCIQQLINGLQDADWNLFVEVKQ